MEVEEILGTQVYQKVNQNQKAGVKKTSLKITNPTLGLASIWDENQDAGQGQIKDGMYSMQQTRRHFFFCLACACTR